MSRTNDMSIPYDYERFEKYTSVEVEVKFANTYSSKWHKYPVVRQCMSRFDSATSVLDLCKRSNRIWICILREQAYMNSKRMP